MPSADRSDTKSPIPLGRRFFRLAWINILSNLTVPLVGLVDTAMLGHLDDIAFLAGVALATVIFDYVYWTFGFLRMGTTGPTAQAVGRGDAVEADLVLQRSLAVACAVAAALVVLQVPLREAGFAVLSGAVEVEAAGRAYFDARIWGAPATLCGFALVGWFLGREESRYVLVMTVVANLTNVALDYWFIVRLGMAARGAGLATALSQYVMVAIGLAIYLRCRDPVPWRLARLLDGKSFAAMLRLNLDILVRTLCLISSFALFVNFSSMLGTATLAANSILLRLIGVASYLIDGAAFASESLAGIFHGRRDATSLRGLFRLALLSGVGFAAAFLVCFFAAERYALRLLTSHADLVDACARYAPWLVPVLLLGSVAYMYDGLFLGLAAGRTLRNSMLFSGVVVFAPVALLAVRLGSNALLWTSLVLFMAARGATLALAWRSLD